MDNLQGKAPRENLTSIAKIAAQHFGVTSTIDKLQEDAGSLILELGKYRRFNFENKLGVQVYIARLTVQMSILQQMLDPQNTDLDNNIQQELRRVKEQIRDERAEIDRQRPKTIGEGRLEGASKKDHASC